jgi:multiple sugar transport system substrate-binding protein
MTELSLALTRRHAMALLGATAAGTILGSRAFAQQTVLDVFGHRVHQTAATTGNGGDLVGPFTADTSIGVNWTVLGDNNAIHERLLREISLSTGSIDVAYMLNLYATPQNLSLFEPLDEFIAAKPVEHFEDFSPGLLAPMQFDGKLYGLPVRHATNTLVYNEKILEERGIAVPTTFEEFLEAARQGTFRRDNGQDVFGLAMSGTTLSFFVSLARAYGGDYMAADGTITANEEPIIRALTALAELYSEGVIPRGITADNGDDAWILGGQGRALFTLTNYASLVRRNSVEESGEYAGSFKPLHMPMAEGFESTGPYAGTLQFWSIMIPRNGTKKQAAYDLIHALTTPEAQLAMALNGNGPTRGQVYARPEIQELLPFASHEAEALAQARPHLPAFNEAARVQDIFLEESQVVVLGHKTAEQAMADATRRAQPLVHAG